MGHLTMNRKGLQTRLEKLAPEDRAAFALACAERLIPAYSRFHSETGQGDPQLLVHAHRVAQKQLLNRSVPRTDIAAVSRRCEGLVPVEDDSWTDLSGLAQNAVAAMVFALRSLVSGSAEDASWAGVQAYEAADLVATTELDVDFNEPGVEERIRSQDVVQRELRAQEQALKALEAEK